MVPKEFSAQPGTNLKVGVNERLPLFPNLTESGFPRLNGFGGLLSSADVVCRQDLEIPHNAVCGINDGPMSRSP